MRQRYIIFLICVSAIATAVARTSVSGVVKTADGRRVDFVNVIAAPSHSIKTILASAFTDENGRFDLAVDYECDSLVLKASGVDIASAQIVIPNRSGDYDIVVGDRTVELKEVVVKAKKIYSQGDTINYNVASFLSKTDASVADVLKKMPGITVSDAGQVSYQGKPIKNFYIEGLDL